MIIMELSKDYYSVINILETNYDEFFGLDFYSYIFSDNQCTTDYGKDYFKPNSIYLYRDESTSKIKRRIMLKDTWTDDYCNYVEENKFTLCSGMSFIGKKNLLDNAVHMNALIFDLDGVGEKELSLLLKRFSRSAFEKRSVPKPTFLVASGGGLHLYYVFKTPIQLFPNIKLQLKELKYELTQLIWDFKATSTYKQIQHQPISQGFRMVGSVNEKYGNTIRAFKIGNSVNLKYLNSYVSDASKVDESCIFKPTKMSLKEAETKFPDWYDRVVINKNKKRKKWNIGERSGDALYKWWLDKINQPYTVKGGHRYYYAMCCVVYAVKCDVPYEKVKKDLYSIFEDLKNEEHENEFTKYDIECALEMYSKDYYMMSIETIERLTDIRINRSRRNYRKQKEHLVIARAIRDIKADPWWINGGRKSKEEEVKKIIKDNPNLSVTKMSKKYNISRPTIYKYMKKK